MTKLKEQARNGVKESREGSKEKRVNRKRKRKTIVFPNIFHIFNSIQFNWILLTL